nr:MAG TPA: 4Fe-4S single cluster domain protein [Caudoviricetes sp.]
MNFHKITRNDIANGVGIRTVLWVSGCSHHCKGCHNPETWDINSGKLFTEDDYNTLIEYTKPDYVNGLTLSGGDPFHILNRDYLVELLVRFKKHLPNKSIWSYTGYSWDDIKNTALIKNLDVLVDGKFIESKKDVSLDYCGSYNQRVIDVQKSLKSGEIKIFI